jgi:hypothetical protein
MPNGSTMNQKLKLRRRSDGLAGRVVVRSAFGKPSFQPAYALRATARQSRKLSGLVGPKGFEPVTQPTP